MEKSITFENLRNFAYCNDRICNRPISGIVISFPGLRASKIYSEDTEEGKYYGKRCMLYVLPYTNPWSWMNRQALNYTEEIIEVLMEALELPEDIPVVATGGSMGGQSALVYTYYARKTPVACVPVCPPCDIAFHYTERVDLPRTFYNAFFYENCSMQEALDSVSPLVLADRMPDIDYYVFHCEKDSQVNKGKHSDVFVEKLKVHHRVQYYIVPGRDHCDLSDDMTSIYRKCITNSIEAHFVRS